MEPAGYDLAGFTFMADKVKPIGICDLCGEQIPRGEWYTTKGQPRLHCSLECKQTANSRNGNPIRIAKLIKRIKAGLWKNPRADLDQGTISALNSAASKKGRLREIAEGHWRNPALSDQAREKLSRPRLHGGALHSAIEKLRTLSMQDLTDEERSAYHEYRAQLRDARRDELNADWRERYHERQAQLTDDEREQQRATWRKQNKRRSRKP